MPHPLSDTWAINARITQYLLDGIADAALPLPIGTGKRTIRDLFAHAHDVRLMWLMSARPELMAGLSKLGTGSAVDRAGLSASLGASAAAIATLVDEAAAGDGRVRGFKPHVTAFVGYLFAHEAHHRGQVALAARNGGHPLDRKVSYGLWEWGVR
ncbi:MAG TPA: DinB family protein [Luteitalea sp.]|nr:DinB family protein [Luteitalea sp.]